MKKILIIEDDQIVAEIYRNKLSHEGFDVKIAVDGESGLESLRRFHPDGVILDLMLPKLSGVDVLKEVRADPEFAELPVIVFSNTYLTNMVQDAWKAGATKCLSKASCSPKQFVSVVKATVGASLPAAHKATVAEPPPAATTEPPEPPPVATTKPPEPPQPPPVETAPAPRPAFLNDLPSVITPLRTLLQACSKEAGAAQLARIDEMYRYVHALTGKAALGGLSHVAQMSDALEALLMELHEKPSNLNVSTLRTVATAIDFLGLLVDRGLVTDKPEELLASILVVDDEPISRRAIIHALDKAKLKAISVENAEVAYDLITQTQFDLIFLDVDMPGMNGYELCAKLRALPAYKSTPVVFVTGLSDFETRANSMMSGGNDFIVKPFLFIELAVKTLVYVLRARLQRA